MTRRFVILAGILGCTGVIAGAFGAHGLEGRLDAHMLDVWNTGARYQIYHAIALLGAAWVCERFPGRAATVAGWLFVVGVVIFSGSLYALALSGIKWLGAVTPLGGLALIVGWALLGVAGCCGGKREQISGD
ncbi:MAG: DUF423 domain-containing protein [Phycisphaera sp.]|nr:DUF423 domain-containing protein [Phycisphaera sp.]